MAPNTISAPPSPTSSSEFPPSAQATSPKAAIARLQPVSKSHTSTSIPNEPIRTSPTKPSSTKPRLDPNKAPQPSDRTKSIFDPWNSSSTGHQRAENRLSSSTSWRDSRHIKLSAQFGDRSLHGGGRGRVADTVGAGSEGFGEDGRTENGGWVKRAPGLRGAGQKGLDEYFAGERNDVEDKRGKKESRSRGVDESKRPRMFDGLTFYINGTTYPLVSDHKLKHLIAQHGGNVSIALARRKVTHVILGHNSLPGLAGGKVQKEIETVRGKGVKFVDVGWVLACVKRGKRVVESEWSKLVGAGKGQASVWDGFKGTENGDGKPE